MGHTSPLFVTGWPIHTDNFIVTPQRKSFHPAHVAIPRARFDKCLNLSTNHSELCCPSCIHSTPKSSRTTGCKDLREFQSLLDQIAFSIDFEKCYYLLTPLPHRCGLEIIETAACFVTFAFYFRLFVMFTFLPDSMSNMSFKANTPRVPCA